MLYKGEVTVACLENNRIEGLNCTKLLEFVAIFWTVLIKFTITQAQARMQHCTMFWDPYMNIVFTNLIEIYLLLGGILMLDLHHFV